MSTNVRERVLRVLNDASSTIAQQLEPIFAEIEEQDAKIARLEQRLNEFDGRGCKESA